MKFNRVDAAILAIIGYLGSIYYTLSNEMLQSIPLTIFYLIFYASLPKKD